MALYSSPENPGNWNTFIKRNHVRNLTLAEQKKIYLVEQLQFDDFVSQQAFLQSNSLNALNNQQHQGGNLKNKVKSVAFGGTLQSISSNTTYIDVIFNKSVSISGAGVPFINVVNNQVGGGTLTPVPYTYSTGAGSTKLRFIHEHPSTPSNNGEVAANVITVGADLAGSATGTISGGAAAAYTGVTFTGAGSDIVADVILDGGGVLSNITFLSQATAAYDFKPGDTLTITAAAIGSGGTGTITVTLVANDLTGDVLTLAASSIDENGSEIYNTSNNPGAQLDLSYTSAGTITAVAS